MKGDSGRGARVIGRYALYGEIASGGMATVHLGRLLGPVGFSRVVAIKRLHPQFAKDPEFVSMFLDEARLAARVRHPNVVSMLDVVALERELLLVLDYIVGESLSSLLRAVQRSGETTPPEIVSAILVGALYGLHAAHEAKSEHGEAMEIVHRDVSPQNIMVGVDGVPRVLDFGIAKAAGRVHHTREGVLKGKVAYMPPEQLKGRAIDRRADVYAASAVLWEALVGARLFDGENEWQLAEKVMTGEVKPPSTMAPHVPKAIDAIVLAALSRDPADRPPTALAFAAAIERAVPPASTLEVGAFVEAHGGSAIARRGAAVAEIEGGARGEGTVTTAVPHRAGTPRPPTRAERDERAPLPREEPGGTRRIAERGEGPTRAVARGEVLADDAPIAHDAAAETPVAPHPERPRRRALKGGLVAVLIALLSLASWLGRPRVPAPEAQVTPSSSASAREAPPLASESPRASGPPSAAPSAIVPVATPPLPKTAPARPPPASKAGCTPPWTIDARGIKRLRPECL